MANQKLKSAAYHVRAAIMNKEKAELHMMQAKVALPKKEEGLRELIEEVKDAFLQGVAEVEALAEKLEGMAETEHPEE